MKKAGQKTDAVEAQAAAALGTAQEAEQKEAAKQAE